MSDIPDEWIELYDKADDYLQSKDYSLLNDLKETREMRYTKLSFIAKGAMKEVYSALDTVLDRDVAIAIPIHHDTPDEIENFLKEARILSSLEHPNILPVYDLGVNADEIPYFTTKLNKGKPLTYFLKEVNCTEKQFIKIDLLNAFSKILEGIAYAHSQEVVHLDLKPDNIQISDFGEVLICDWGLTKLNEKVCADVKPFLLEDDLLAIHGIKYQTLKGQIKGTPGYMAPEQIDTSISPKDRRTDVFSLGLILYEMITFRNAIAGDSVVNTINKTMSNAILSPSEVRPDLNIPYEIEAICLKAISFDPQLRYQTVNQFLSDLNLFRQGLPLQYIELPALRKLRLFHARNYKYVYGLCSLASIIILICCYVLVIQGEQITERRESLAKITQANNFNKELLVPAANSYNNYAQIAFNNNNVDQALALADKALSLCGNHKDSLLLKARCLFVQQNYAEANKFFLLADVKSYIFPDSLSDNFNKDLLLFDLLKKLDDDYLVANAIDFYLKQHNYDSLIFKKMWQHLLPNRKGSACSLKQNGSEFSLELNGSKFFNLRYVTAIKINTLFIDHCEIKKIPVELLKMRSLKYLRLGDNPITSNLHVLKQLKLTRLNIKNTPIDDFRVLPNSLKKLTLSKGMFTESELLKLRENIEIVLK